MGEVASLRQQLAASTLAASVKEAAIDAAFNAIDSSGDGRISQREWEIARSASMPTFAPVHTTLAKETAINVAFNAIDADGNGRISQREWDVATQTKAAQISSGGAAGFCLLGRVSDAVHTRSAHIIGGTTVQAKDAAIDAAFNAMDTDGDGRISKMEWDVAQTRSASMPTVNATDVAAQTGFMASTTQPRLRLASPTACVLKSASSLRDTRLSSPPARSQHTV